MEYERSRMTIWSFLKNLFKVVIGFSLLVQSLLFLLLIVFIFGLIGSVSSSLSGKGNDEGPTIAVPDGGALVLNPEGVLVETSPPADPFGDAVAQAFGGAAEAQVSVHDLVKTLRHAAKDDRIAALVLDLQGLYIPAGSASKAHYLAQEVEAFRETGKRVIAIGDFYTQEQYLVASEADEVLMHDMGTVLIEGYGRYRTYYKSALDKLKVTAHVFRVGTFKSALEPFLRDDMSPEAADANRAYLNVLWEEYQAAVDENRGFTPGTINAYAQSPVDAIRAAGGDMAGAAEQAGLVDALMSRGEMLDRVAAIVGRDKDKNAGFKGISYRSYRFSVPGAEDRGRVPNVAIITAAGTIVDGDEPYGVAAGDYIARQLRDARFDENVKAVVLRVDSPGGSAFASEIIRDELLAVKAAGKPVIVSMGSLAASGGYWISANADEIWAAPTTLTGSIGVFGFFPTFENTAADLGVFVDGVGTAPLSAIQGAGVGPLPEEVGEIFQASVEDTYGRFISIVSEGRGMSEAQADAIAQGRVWIGKTAQQLGLVSRLGTIDDAIAAAAARAGLEEYDVVGMVREKSRFELFLEALAGNDEVTGSDMLVDEMFAERRSNAVTLGRLLQMAQKEVKFLSSFNDPNGVYVRCAECTLE